MYASRDLTVDITERCKLGGATHTAVSVFLPEPDYVTTNPVVCFAFPGGGYCRRYFSLEMPDGPAFGQAQWHAERGWIVVACDSLGFGEATIPEDDVLDYETVAAGNHATVEAVLDLLETESILDGYPPVRDPTTLGIGQSMGGCFTIVQQAHHGTFDGVGILGSSGTHTVVPGRPGLPSPTWPWLLRGSDTERPKILNQAALDAAPGLTITGSGSLQEIGESAVEHPLAWSFHYDDEPAALVAADMAAAAGRLRGAELPPWRSATTPACGIYMVAPGTVATEAASIAVPVFVGVGERDVVPHPWLEPLAYKSALDITIFICPGMAHMHNFANTRELFWQRIQSWGDGVSRMRTLASARQRAHPQQAAR